MHGVDTTQVDSMHCCSDRPHLRGPGPMGERVWACIWVCPRLRHTQLPVLVGLRACS